MEAIRAGKHILADKPLLNGASAERIAKAAAEKGVLFMDATHFVHHARTALLREKLREGVIGQVETLSASFFCRVF